MVANTLSFEPEAKTTPEQRYIVGIIAQAFEDMSTSATKDRHQSRHADNDARSAMLFLTERYGAHANWRNDLCSLIDVDGDLLTQRVRMILDYDLTWPQQRRSPGVTISGGAKEAERARAIWQHLKKRLQDLKPRSSVQL